MNKTRFVLLLGGLAISLSVQAASFDCAKAKSIVENLICADPDLSRLDDELAKAYTAALQNKGRADEVRRDQKRWLKDRNDCMDLVCIKYSYEVRLSSILAAHPPSSNGEISRPKSTLETRLPAYGHCVDVGIPGSCEQGGLAKSGKGYTVCETYLKHLNSLVEIPKCEAPVPPGFRKPDWEEMDVLQHLGIAYQAEKHFFAGLGGYVHPEFEQWKQQALKEIQAGKIAPQMRKTRVQPFGKEVITILAYTRDQVACANEAYRQNSYWASNGHAHFLLSGDPLAPLRVIENWTSRSQSELLLYRGKPYFVQRFFYETSVRIIAFDLEMTNTTRETDRVDAYYSTTPPGSAVSAGGPIPDEIKTNSNLYWADELCHFSKVNQLR